MGQIYTAHDIRLRDAALLRINFFDPDNQFGGSRPGNVRFQFPPRITSDNRKGAWNEADLRGNEPVAVFKTSSAREISLSWTYIVDGKEFTTAQVASQTKLIRGYFAGIRNRDKRWRNLVVRFRYILHGDGMTDISARIKSIDIKHSDTIVTPAGGSIENSFPLRTDINIALRLWTKGGPGDTLEPTQDLQEVRDRLTPGWY